MNDRVLTLAVLLVGLPLAVGCQDYGPVSDNTYEYASALYSICNLKDQQRLDAFRQKVEESEEMPNNEKAWILDIVALAEDGKWADATQRSRTMLDEQVKK